MEKQKKCNHKLTLPLYARGEDKWISSKQLSGQMIYICTKCGALFDKGFIKRKDKLETTESHSAGDALCEGGENGN